MKKRVFMAFLMALTLAVLPLGEASMRVSAEEKDQQTAVVSVSGGDAEGNIADDTKGDAEGDIVSYTEGDAEGDILGYTENGTGSKEKLPTPTNLAWDDNFNLTFGAVAESRGSYELEVYKDNAMLEIGGWSASTTEGMVTLSFSRYINESGKYKFRVRSKAAYDDTTYMDSDWSAWSEVNEYMHPGKALGTTVGYWDTQKAGLFHWEGVEGAGGYDLRLYKQDKSDTWVLRGSHLWARNNDCDVSDIIAQQGEGKYRVTVTALSNDITKIANGPEGEPSEILDTTANTNTLDDILSEAMENNDAEKAVETLTEKADISAIQQAMQTSGIFRDKVGELEKDYCTQKKISVHQSVSEKAGQYVDSSKISMVGAAFNVAENSTSVTLNVDVTPEKDKVPLSNYLNSVQLDIKLDSGNTSISELIMPITITMPIPQGIHGGQLVILHYHKDGAKETVAFKNNGDGTVTFTVQSFSTFVFAEGSGNTHNDSSTDSSSSTGSGSSTGGGSGSAHTEAIEARIDAALPGAVVKISRAENMNALPNSIMHKLVERKNVTLVLECTYKGVDYTITIPAGQAIDSDIPWYGPLYLIARYGNGAPAAAGVSGSVYTVRAKDTLGKIARENGMTVVQLAAKNPQIKNVDLIHIGQNIHLQ